MKKVLALILTAVMVMGLLAACGGNSKNGGGDSGNSGNAAPSGDNQAGDTQSGGGKSAADVKIVLLLPGEINDQGWNASNYAGVVACNEQLGTSMEYVEAVQEADFESTFREYAERGYDIIMAAGSQFDEAASTVAAGYPNTLFMVVKIGRAHV